MPTDWARRRSPTSARVAGSWRGRRSEEHTSELQTQFHPPCSLFFFLTDAATPQIPPSPPPRRSPDLMVECPPTGPDDDHRHQPGSRDPGGAGDRKSTRLNSRHSSIPHVLFFFS